MVWASSNRSPDHVTRSVYVSECSVFRPEGGYVGVSVYAPKSCRRLEWESKRKLARDINKSSLTSHSGGRKPTPENTSLVEREWDCCSSISIYIAPLSTLLHLGEPTPERVVIVIHQMNDDGTVSLYISLLLIPPSLH